MSDQGHDKARAGQHSIQSRSALMTGHATVEALQDTQQLKVGTPEEKGWVRTK